MLRLSEDDAKKVLKKEIDGKDPIVKEEGSSWQGRRRTSVLRLPSRFSAAALNPNPRNGERSARSAPLEDGLAPWGILTPSMAHGGVRDGRV